MRVSITGIVDDGGLSAFNGGLKIFLSLCLLAALIE